MKVTNRPMAIVSKTLPLSERVQKKLELVTESRDQWEDVCWEKGLTVLDEETVKMPLIKRKALAIKAIMTKVPVSIGRYDMVVGSATQGSAGYPRYAKPFPDYATPEEEDAAAKKLTWVTSVQGHYTPYYTRYLKIGLSGLRKIAEDKLEKVRRKGTEPGKEAWYESVIISLDGLREYIRRHAELAIDLMEIEADGERKAELAGIVETLQHLLQGPPRTFRDALQAFFLAHISFFNTWNHLPLGRFDQNLWPYLERDLEKGLITLKEAQELVDSLWLKLNEVLHTFQGLVGGPANTKAGCVAFLGGKTSRDRRIKDGSEVQQYLQTLTLGGLTPEGVDGTNPLTYICLNATYRLKVAQPCLYVRLHDKTPAELYERAADCIRAGCIGPTIYNDEVIVPSLVKIGIPVEHARDYTSDGCFEVHIQGKAYFLHSYLSVAEAMDRVFNWARWENAEVPLYIKELDPFRDVKPVDPYGLRSFDEVMAAVKENLDTYIKGYVAANEVIRKDHRLYDIAPLPLLSAFVEGPLEASKDITQGGMQYYLHMPELVGLSHVADSLAVIKKLCFEEKTVKWSDLLDAVRNNWEERESLRQVVRTRVPAYGNNVDYVDDIAKEIVEFYVKSLRKHSAGVPDNVKYVAGIATFEWYAALGVPIGATPDGRLSGEPLGTNASPSIGRPVNGQTAVVNSYVKLPLVDLPGGSIIDLNISRRAGLLLQLEALIRSFVEERGNVMNIAVNDCEKLKAAVKEPEKYRDLKVRVGGYEAYFVDLSPLHQELQIRRCEQYA